MGFNYYERHHLSDNVYSKQHIDNELSKKANNKDMIDSYHSIFNKELSQVKIFWFNNTDHLHIPFNLAIISVTLYIEELDDSASLEQYKIKINDTVQSLSESISLIQNFTLPNDTNYTKDELINIAIYDLNNQISNIKKAHLTILYKKLI